MNALVQDAAQTAVTFDDEDILHAVAAGGGCGGKTGRAAADNGKLYMFHLSQPSLVWPAIR